jgi:hypothetical protein
MEPLTPLRPGCLAIVLKHPFRLDYFGSEEIVGEGGENFQLLTRRRIDTGNTHWFELPKQQHGFSSLDRDKFLGCNIKIHDKHDENLH